MGKGKPDLLHGTLDLLILRSLTADPMHGWAISKHIEQISREVLEVNQGSLYPALYRLEGRGWIEAAAGGSPPRGGGPSSTPSLPPAASSWPERSPIGQAFSLAVNRVLGTA